MVQSSQVNKRKWLTESEKQYVRLEIQKGTKPEAIAYDLQRHKATINHFLIREQNPEKTKMSAKSYLSEAEKEYIKEERKKGARTAVIAVELGRDQTTIYNYMRKEKIPLSQPRRKFPYVGYDHIICALSLPA